jgi:hypothetical protein
LPTNENRPDIIILKIDGARALQEAKFYVNLTRHPHVVRTFGLALNKKKSDEKSDDDDDDDEDNSVMLIQEYAHEGSLLELLQEREKRLDENILIEIFLQIIDAMIFLAYNHVVHGIVCKKTERKNVDAKNIEKKMPKKNCRRKKCRWKKCRKINVEATLVEEKNVDHIKCRKFQDVAIK